MDELIELVVRSLREAPQTWRFCRGLGGLRAERDELIVFQSGTICFRYCQVAGTPDPRVKQALLDAYPAPKDDPVVQAAIAKLREGLS